MATWKRQLLTVALTVVGATYSPAQEPRQDLYGDPLPAGAISRIGTIRLRTPGEISRVALNSDGTLLVTADDYLPLRVWDATTGALLREIAPPTDVTQAGRGAPALVSIATMAFPADSRRWLHVLTADGTLRECDVTDGTWSESLARTETPGDIYRFAGGRVSPDRTHFLYTPFDDKFKGIEVFAVGKGKPILRIEDPGFGRYGRASSVSADNGLLAAVLEDGTAKVWDLKTGKAVATHTAPDGVFYSVAISPDGKSLAAVCGPKGRIGMPPPAGTFLYGWDPTTGKERFRTPSWEGLYVTYSPNGSRLVSFAGNEVLVADPATGKLIHRLQSHGAWMIFGHAFSADGKRLVTGGRDHSAIIWDLAAGKPALDFDSPRGPVNILAFSPDGKTLFTGCSDDLTGGLWDAETGKRKHRLVADKKGRPNCATFTPDGRHVLVGYWGGGSGTGKDWARLWSVADGKLVREFGGHTDGVHRLVISPDGKQFGTWDWGKKVRLWDMTGRMVKEADWAEYNATSDLVYPRARELIGVKFDRANAWEAVNLISGKTLGRGDEKGNGSKITLSPDGRLAAVLDGPSYGRVTIREVATGNVVRTLSPLTPSSLSVMAFSHDSRVVAVSSGHDGVALRLFDVNTGREQRVIRGHQGRIASLAFSPDGKRLATGGADSSVLVWDLTVRP